MMEDCISREQALEALRAIYDIDSVYENGYDYISYEYVVADIEDLPSVQPMRPKGEWICYHFGAYYVCSCCNERNNRRDKFCPNCGADMREENNDG